MRSTVWLAIHGQLSTLSSRSLGFVYPAHLRLCTVWFLLPPVPDNLPLLSASTTLTVLAVSSKWNHGRSILLCLACFTWHIVLQVHILLSRFNNLLPMKYAWLKNCESDLHLPTSVDGAAFCRVSLTGSCQRFPSSAVPCLATFFLWLVVSVFFHALGDPNLYSPTGVSVGLGADKLFQWCEPLKPT